MPDVCSSSHDVAAGDQAAMGKMTSVGGKMIKSKTGNHMVLESLEEEIIFQLQQSLPQANCSQDVGERLAALRGGENGTDMPHRDQRRSTICSFGSEQSLHIGECGTMISKKDPAYAKAVKANLFVDAEEMRKRARANLDQKEYNVADLYNDSAAAKVAMSDWFGWLTLVLIFVNAIWIGLETDLNDADTLGESDPGWQAGEHLFCIFFTIELLIRFAAFKEKTNCLYDGWFRFDLLLVCFMVFETWIIGNSNVGNVVVLRLFRLLRLTRMARLMRSVPELMTIFKGMTASTRSVMTTLCVLLLITYVFSIVFKVFLGNQSAFEEYFSTIPDSMWTLFITGALFDNMTTVLNLLGRDALMCFLFVMYMVISAFVTLNMLIGILCEVISAVAVAEKEKLLVEFVKARLLTVLGDHDPEGNQEITKDGWPALLEDIRMLKCLDDLGIENEHMACLGETLFEEEVFVAKEELQGMQFQNVKATRPQLKKGFGTQMFSAISRTGSLSWTQFMETLLQMRPGNHASIVHMMELRKFARIKVANIERKQLELQDQLNQICEGMLQLVAEKQQAAASNGGPRPRPASDAKASAASTLSPPQEKAAPAPKKALPKKKQPDAPLPAPPAEPTST